MAQVTIGTHTFDVLVGLDEAGRHLAGDVQRATGWAIRQPEAQGRGIVSATRLLLGLPLCDAPDLNAPHPVLAEVAAELAADLVAKPKLFADASGSSNIKTAKAGSAQVEFFAPVTGGPPLPIAMWKRLQAAGLICMAGDAANPAVEESGLGGPFVSGISDGCGNRPLLGRYAFDLRRDDCEGLI